ncbi:peptidoglycan endopeptidase [Dyella dinghuensis]|uniref:Peptidoglycan endopeptidase n=1 Tax=Dyella dinghuensis TaxID=1920169 RepID=A0A432LRD6_9GAMM|nr:C40 family peptidase [Dyella dinghuensis]RUL62497.1 peptidoglycan endopeptidase [Dyella dinghuensis]
MPKTRLVLAALASAMCFSTPALAATVDSGLQAQVSAKISSSLLSPLNAFTPASTIAQAALPTQLPIGALATAKADTADTADKTAATDVSSDTQLARDLRDTLIGLAMDLRHTRYVRGGHDPSTGFDCSGFVRYVFEHAIGLQLPTNSASQFMIGHTVARNDMQPGDLVFFRTAGRHGKGRVSHVGIYLSDGHFIHSPRRGESVRVDSLADSYWSQRFAGARRPAAMASIDSGTHNG